MARRCSPPVLPHLPRSFCSLGVQHYCRFGGDGDSGSGLTSRNFVKLLRDKGAIDKTITTTVADLSFTKAAAGGKRLSYGQFRYALELCAQEKGISMAAFAEKLGSGAGAGPVSTPSSGAAPSYWTPGTENLQDDKGVQYHGVTKPQYNRFYGARRVERRYRPPRACSGRARSCL